MVVTPTLRDLFQTRYGCVFDIRHVEYIVLKYARITMCFTMVGLKYVKVYDSHKSMTAMLRRCWKQGEQRVRNYVLSINCESPLKNVSTADHRRNARGATVPSRQSRWPRGKVLGGSSVLNYMLYIRGNRRDYDRWEQELDCEGWGWKSVLPYFIKSEDNRDPGIAHNGYHGRGGYLTVSTPPYVSPLAHAFVEAGETLGYPNIDLNGPTQTGFAIPQSTLRRGARCSTAKAFLEPGRGRPNLHILVRAQVTKVLFDENRRARSVLFRYRRLQRAVRARQEIILSAGSIGSAQLLMLSGVGPRLHLESLGIPVISDIPVGENLQDHIGGAGISFMINDSVSVVRKRFNPKTAFDYFIKGQDTSLLSAGPLTVPGGVEGIGFIRTKYNAQHTDWPDVEVHFVSSTPAADGGSTIRRVMGMTDEVEAHFRLRRITSQQTRHWHLVSCLPPDVADDLADIIASPHPSHPYDTLKAAIVSRKSKSEHSRLQQLITATELSDRRPSQLQRRMRQLLGGPSAPQEEKLLR
ncbi:hypothetical protein HPB51_018090 [Rhipicephalus microplus]|uniref:Glucose-methanol-choline oxidoreductase N-terminal domain-containing protein n=1 Tax=Rhipicephalus microplus TaxID=6941 RepID=A0A9J6EB85_RHIMP|nr:hypothetical protein HPB51_018090 [Rhipicephalus microplus]